MKKTIKALKFPIAFLFTVVSLIACDRDFNVVESDVLGEGNTNFTTGSNELPVVAYNKKLDSLQIDGLTSNMLGVFNDPAYGLTSASIVSQIAPTAYSPDFGDNTAIDSVVINIPYYSTIVNYDDDGNPVYQIDSLYGSATTPIKIGIYQNNYYLRDFDPNATDDSAQKYFSNANSAQFSMLTGTQTVNFDEHIGGTILEIQNFIPSSNPVETTTGEGEDAVTTLSAPAFRHVITSDSGKEFWDNAIIDKEEYDVLSNASNFLNYFRGIYIKAEPLSSDGNMLLLDLASTEANITIHYSKDSTTEGERTQSTYVFNFTGNIINPFINDYNVSFPTPNKTEGDSKLYLKGQSGSMAVVDLFPNGVQAFKDEYLNNDDELAKLINEVHLLVYEDESITTPGVDSNGDAYHKYDRIYAYDVNNNTYTSDYLNDASGNTSAPFSSKVISLSQRDTITGKFKIRLTEHFYNILVSDSTNTKIGLVITNNVNYYENAEILNSNDDVTGVPASTIISPRGTILHGSNSSVPEDKRLKLKIFFTEPK